MRLDRNIGSHGIDMAIKQPTPGLVETGSDRAQRLVRASSARTAPPHRGRVS
jgi:hypothetical protein